MFHYIKKFRYDALIPEPLTQEIMAETGLTPYEILQDDKYYPVDKLMKLFIDGIDGNNFDANVSNSCEKMLVVKFSADRKINSEILEKFLNDDSLVVSTYTAFRLNRIEKMEEICKKLIIFTFCYILQI